MLEAAFILTVTCVVLPGVVSDKWEVSFPTPEVCVWRGMTATLPCQYDYPYRYTVRRVMWFRLIGDGKWEYAFHTDANTVSPSYKGRTKYSGGHKLCSLQISNIKTTDGGQYYFRFETNNPQGRWTSTDVFTLSVTDLQVQVHPARQGNVFAAGETVYLSCVARGCAAAGRTLALYRDDVYIQAHSPMTIHNFDHKHAGTYNCRPGSLPNIQSVGVTLSIGYAPRWTAVVLRPQGPVPEGSPLTLICSSDAQPSVDSFSWFKDGATWSIPASFNPQLHLENAGPSDLGYYTCRAQNILGTEKSASAFVNITYAPRNTTVIISPPGDIMEGLSVTLTCSTNANPPVVQYKWFITIGSQSWDCGDTQNLSLNSIHVQHAGRYYCTVWNQHGQDTSTTNTLVVLYAPKNTSASMRPSGDVEVGSSVTLTCSSNANPEVENYTWFKINKADTRETRSGSSFTITAITDREGGQYYCEARNRLGAHNSPVLTVRVRGRLKVIALVSAVGVSAGLITLTVLIMISKNMHVVESEPAEEDQQVPKQEDTLFHWTLTNTDEDQENVYENMHPSIVPIEDVTQNSEDNSLNYVTVHFSKNSSVKKKPSVNAASDDMAECQCSTDIIYTVLAKPQ